MQNPNPVIYIVAQDYVWEAYDVDVSALSVLKFYFR